jgi:hypothetical protein
MQFVGVDFLAHAIRFFKLRKICHDIFFSSNLKKLDLLEIKKKQINLDIYLFLFYF